MIRLWNPCNNGSVQWSRGARAPRPLPRPAYIYEAITDAIAMGVDIYSMNRSVSVEFDSPQTSDIAETMAKRLLEGFH